MKLELLKEMHLGTKTNVAYLINTLLNIINRWNYIKIDVYIFKDMEEKRK